MCLEQHGQRHGFVFLDVMQDLQKFYFSAALCTSGMDQHYRLFIFKNVLRTWPLGRTHNFCMYVCMCGYDMLESCCTLAEAV